MRINLGNEKRKEFFEKLETGDIFKFNENIYMVIESHYSDCSDKMINVVDLRDGSIDFFYDTCIVEVIVDYDFTINE